MADDNLLKEFVQRRGEKLLEEDRIKELERLEASRLANRSRESKIFDNISKNKPEMIDDIENAYDLEDMFQEGARSPRELEKTAVRKTLRNVDSDDLEQVHDNINRRNRMSSIMEGLDTADIGIDASKLPSKVSELDQLPLERDQMKKLSRMAAKEGHIKTSALKKLGKGAFRKLPMIGGLAGLLTSEDASAMIPGLSEAEDIGPEEGSLERKLEMGEATPEDLQKLEKRMRRWKALEGNE